MHGGPVQVPKAVNEHVGPMGGQEYLKVSQPIYDNAGKHYVRGIGSGTHEY